MAPTHSNVSWAKKKKGKRKKYTSESLYKVYSKAVAKIHIYQMGIPVSFGTGFFVDKEGTMVTNAHVFADSLVAGNRARFEFKDGTVIKKHLIGKCRDARGIDLCVVKLPIKPKAWIPLGDVETIIGQKVYALGHPRGYDFSISDGLISATRKLNTTSMGNQKLKGIEQIQISAPISPGNSGGPVFNDSGQLVGVSTWIRTDKGSQNLNFAIAVSEVIKFLKDNKKFITRKQWREDRNKMLKMIRAGAKASYKPAYEYVKKVNALKTPAKAGPIPKGFYMKKFAGVKNDIRVILPDFIDKCDSRKTKYGYTYRCIRSGTYNALYIEVYWNKGMLTMLKSGKKVFDGKPLPIVKQLQKAKQWEKTKKNLTLNQIKYLHSVQKDKAKCKSYNKPDQVFSRGSYEKCSFFVSDYNYPGQIMGGSVKHYETYQETVGIYYEVKSDYRSYYSKAASLAALSTVLTPRAPKATAKPQPKPQPKP